VRSIKGNKTDLGSVHYLSEPPPEKLGGSSKNENFQRALLFWVRIFKDPPLTKNKNVLKTSLYSV